MTRFKTISFAALLIAAPFSASAQSSPNWYQNFVPTPAQWNNMWASKQDTLGYSPLNRAGDRMLGKLTLWGAMPSGASLNIPVGQAPTSPVNGDVWMTNFGLFVRINNATVGPVLGGVTASSPLVAATSNATTNVALNYNSTLALSGANLGLNLANANTWSGSQTFSAATRITDNTASSSSTTGALTVSGGLGVAQKVYAADSVNSSVSNAADVQFIATQAGTGRAGLQVSHASGGGRATIQQDSSGSFIFQSAGTSQRTDFYDKVGNNPLTVFGSATAGAANAYVAINSTKQSTSPSNGALTVAGGLGVAGDIHSPNIWADYGAAGNGYALLHAGDTTHSGYVGWFNPSGTRLGYMGFDSANVNLNLENGAVFGVSGGLSVFFGGSQTASSKVYNGASDAISTVGVAYPITFYSNDASTNPAVYTKAGSALRFGSSTDGLSVSGFSEWMRGTILGLAFSQSNSYLNFNNTSGSAGYGIRDNGGTMEIKNSGGSWSAISSAVTPNYQQQTFGSSGTFTTPAGTTTATRYHYRGVGGGAGGGGIGSSGTNAVTSGGACGAYVEGTFTGVAAGTAITITIGSGGAGGANSGGNGGAGGDTIIGSPVSITAGGATASLGTNTNGDRRPPTAGGSVTGSPTMLSMAGGRGDWGIQSSDTGQRIGGRGCSGPLGMGGQQPTVDASGANGTGQGSGGSGTSGATAQGGSGMPGIVIINWVQ